MSTTQRLAEVAEQIGLSFDVESLSLFVSSGCVSFNHSPDFTIPSFSWQQYYPVLSFLLNGHLYAEYARMSGWLGLPQCSNKQWHRILERLEVHVTKLAEWSCGKVRQDIIECGNQTNWVASFDGFYLTRGHYSKQFLSYAT